MANSDALQDLEMKTFLDTVDAGVALVLRRHSELSIDDLIIEEFQPDDFDNRAENAWTGTLLVGENTSDATAWNARCDDGKLAMIIGGFYIGNQQIADVVGHITIKVEDNEARRWGAALIDQDFRWLTLAPVVVMEGKRLKIQPTMTAGGTSPDSGLFPFGMVVREK